MRRRGVGIGAIQKEKLAKQKLAAKGEELQEANLQEMSKQMDKFRDNLEKFAVSHKKDIQKDPEFRLQFADPALFPLRVTRSLPTSLLCGTMLIPPPQLLSR